MSNLLKYLLITVISIYITGCSLLRSTPDVEYFTPLKDVSLNIGESAIVHGGMEACGQEARNWIDVSHLLPNSETGFFSNAGLNFMKSEKCNGLVPVLAVRFTANKAGSENLTVFGDPLNIVVGSNTGSVNFLQSGVPNPKTAEQTRPSIQAEPAKPSMLDTLLEWIDRDVK